MNKLIFCYSVTVIVVTLLFTSTMEAQTFKKVLDCNGTGVWVPDTSKFNQDGIDVYHSPFGKIVFVEQNKTIYCAEIGWGWKLDGYSYGTHEAGSGEKLLLFKISGEEIVRYFDIRGRKEVYRVSASDDNLIVSDTAPPEQGKVIDVLQSWKGAKSRIATAEYQRILSQKKWAELWKRHGKESEQAPAIDFTRYMVVIILLGNTVNTREVQVVDVREVDDFIRFRFEPLRYQTLERVDNVTPYGFFLLPRSKKKIRLEEEVQNLIGGPYKWELRAEFDVVD